MKIKNRKIAANNAGNQKIEKIAGNQKIEKKIKKTSRKNKN